MKCLEDMVVMHQLFAHITKLAVIDEALYYYRKHGGSALSAITPAKINDFMKAMVMVRLLLEQAGRFEQYRQSYRALLRKTGVCCYLYTLKMHLVSRRPQGCVRNLKNLHRSLRFYLSDGFSRAPTRMIWRRLWRCRASWKRIMIT